MSPTTPDRLPDPAAVESPGPRPASRADLPVFLATAFGLSWLAALPIWLGGVPLDAPLAQLIGVAMMATPTLGVLAVWRIGHRDLPRREWAARTGLGMGISRRRTLALVVAAWLGVPVLAVLAVAVSVAIGVLEVDLRGFSLFRLAIARSGSGAPPGDPAMLVLVQMASALLATPLINAIPALGEEWGWRGWLLPYLTRYGTRTAILLSGVIWGLWHAPLTLLGYNYARLGAWAAPAFVGFCVIAGAIFAWLRLYSGSVWPPVIAHAAVNAWAGFPMLVGDAAAPPNLFLAGLFGLVGWALLAVLAVILFRVRPPAAPDPADRPGTAG